MMAAHDPSVVSVTAGSVAALPAQKNKTGDHTAAGRDKFYGLEVGRGVAACLVAAYHASNMMVWSGISPVLPFRGIMQEFHVGVDFFFVLSGFLVSWVHWPDIGFPRQLQRYAIRRLTRIYPAYWMVLGPLILIEVIGRQHLTASHVLTSVFLLPSYQQPILGVAWSLVYEIFFYVLFGIVIGFGRPAVLALVVWGSAIVWDHVFVQQTGFPISFVLDPYNLEFLLGIGVAALLRRHRIPAPFFLFVAGSMVFVGAMVFRVGTLLGSDALAWRCIFGTSAGSIILGLMECERSGQARFAPWLAHFGGASYAIYLVHPIAYDIIIRLTKPYISGWSPELLTLLFTLFGISAGVIFHQLLERHVTIWARNLVSRRRHESPERSAHSYRNVH